MNIFDYCTKTGRWFYWASGSDAYAIRYDQFRQQLNWTLLKNNLREGDFDWDGLVDRVKGLPGIGEYL